MKLGSLLLVLCLTCTVTLQQSWMDNPKRLLNPAKVVFALNCGSDKEIQSEHGFTYLPDQYFVCGETSSYSESEVVKSPEFRIRNTRDTELHMNERLGTSGQVQYKLPITNAGEYVLILLFAELNFQKVPQRSMRVLLGSYEIIPEFDIVRTATSFAQVPIYLPFTVLTDGSLLYKNKIDLDDAIVDGNKLHLTLERIRDLPKIDGLILFQGNLSETNYDFINNVNR